MRRPLARLGHSAATRAKLSEARIGKTHSEETKRKISESLRGHTVRPETRQKISDARKREPSTNEGKIIACRLIAQRRWRWMVHTRTNQWKLDQMAALRLGNEHLFQDVKKSGGWTSKRKVRMFPGVSDGWWGKDLRAAFRNSKIGKSLRYGEP